VSVACSLGYVAAGGLLGELQLCVLDDGGGRDTTSNEMDLDDNTIDRDSNDSAAAVYSRNTGGQINNNLSFGVHETQTRLLVSNNDSSIKVCRHTRIAA